MNYIYEYHSHVVKIMSQYINYAYSDNQSHDISYFVTSANYFKAIPDKFFIALDVQARITQPLEP